MLHSDQRQKSSEENDYLSTEPFWVPQPSCNQPRPSDHRNATCVSRYDDTSIKVPYPSKRDGHLLAFVKFIEDTVEETMKNITLFKKANENFSFFTPGARRNSDQKIILLVAALSFIMLSIMSASLFFCKYDFPLSLYLFCTSLPIVAGISFGIGYMGVKDLEGIFQEHFENIGYIDKKTEDLLTQLQENAPWLNRITDIDNLRVFDDIKIPNTRVSSTITEAKKIITSALSALKNFAKSPDCKEWPIDCENITALKDSQKFLSILYDEYHKRCDQAEQVSYSCRR